jgi:2-phospho-L-lactate/phosphoenolpyruvate guanylyltransferase
MPAAVLVPIKDFRQAKQRLSSVLSGDQRKAMAGHVIKAAAPYDVYVVCDDPLVAAFATEHGAQALWCPGLGLNGAITAAIGQIAATISRVVVAHSDLPLATSFAPLLEADGVAIVADRHCRGTNALALPTAAVDFTFHFGSASFRAHRHEAARCRLPLHIIDDPRLAWDVDTPDDLMHPHIQEFFSWLQTNPDNQRSAANHPSPR